MTAATRAQSEAQDRGAGASVLLVDDDELLRESVALLLAHLGFTPVLAGTGEEALAKLAEQLEPILVILDLDMPGMGGACTLAMIRSQRPQLPVVVASGQDPRATAGLVDLFPLVSLMPKPYGLKDLRSRLAQVGLCPA